MPGKRWRPDGHQKLGGGWEPVHLVPVISWPVWGGQRGFLVGWDGEGGRG